MKSSWTSKYAILRDLSVAQGREVPAEITETISKDEKPSAVNYTEETEQTFFENCVSNGDISAGPDIPLIQHMLELVRKNNVTGDNGVNNETVLEVSKISHEGSADIFNVMKSSAQPVENIKKTKRKRNVAVTSLIDAYGVNSHSETESPPNLLKPDDIVSDQEKNVLNSGDDQKEKDIQTVKSSMFMFKKKSSRKIKEDDQKPTETMKSMNSSGHRKPSEFVPSTLAHEYYETYVTSGAQDTLHDDIWTRVNMKMREIDKKREQEKMSSTSSSIEDS